MKALLLAALLCASPALAEVTYSDEQAIELARSIRACQLELDAARAQPPPSLVVPVLVTGLVGVALGAVAGALKIGRASCRERVFSCG